MDETDKGSVMFSKGLNFQELVSEGGTVFEIDVNFNDGKKPLDPLLSTTEDILNDNCSDESDTEEILKNLDDSIEKMMLKSPEYTTFSELATKMTDCLPTGEVKIIIEEEGDGPLVPYDAQVTIHFAAYWEKQTVPFDSTLTMNYGAPKVYRLGCGNLIPGLEVALTTVRGPKARFHTLLQPSVAWGSMGVPPRIKPETCLFTVTLLDVQHLAAAELFNEMPSSEQKKFETTVKAVSASNTLAKNSFNKKSFMKSLKHYHQSLHILQVSCPENDDQRAEITKQLTKVYINLIVCYYKLNMPEKMLRMCDELAKVIDVNDCCKVQYYFGKAFFMKGDYDEAARFYKKALNLEPRNPEIGKAMAELDDVIKKSAKQEKAMWRSAFKEKNLGLNECDDSNDDVDEDLKKTLDDTCQDLAGRSEYTKIDIPSGLSVNEVNYIKRIVKKFEGLVLVEDSGRKNKKISLIKKV